MSRFNSEAYDKLFPREADPAPAPETPVETFRPSQQKTPQAEKPVEDPAPSAEDPAPSVPEDKEVNDDNGGSSESDSE